MNKNEFINQARELFPLHKDKYHPYDPLDVDWCGGGIAGGSCWDDGDSDPHYSYEGDPEPEDEHLPVILEKCFPDLTAKQYLGIDKSKIYEYRDEDTYEYYGNSRTTCHRKLLLDKLFDEIDRVTKL
jgi:hypothetical protein